MCSAKPDAFTFSLKSVLMENKGRNFLRNVGKFLPDYIVVRPKSENLLKEKLLKLYKWNPHTGMGRNCEMKNSNKRSKMC